MEITDEQHDYTDSEAREGALVCRRTKRPLKPGENALEVITRRGVVNQDGEFTPLDVAERSFVSLDATEREGTGRGLKRRVP